MESSLSEGRSSGISLITSLIVLVITLVSDQITKSLIVHNMHIGESIPSSGLIRLTYVTNSGSAFGLFPNQTLFLIIGSFLGIGVLLVFYRINHVKSLLLNLSVGLQMGGAAGNLIDRIRLGYVVDFIDVGLWPVFNIADSAIVVGLLGLLWALKSINSREIPTPAMADEDRRDKTITNGSNTDSLHVIEIADKTGDSWKQSDK